MLCVKWTLENKVKFEIVRKVTAKNKKTVLEVAVIGKVDMRFVFRVVLMSFRAHPAISHCSHLLLNM